MPPRAKVFKCNCGYIQENSFNEQGNFVVNAQGDEMFMRIKGADLETREFTPQEVHLYMCPKCFTIQAEIRTPTSDMEEEEAWRNKTGIVN